MTLHIVIDGYNLIHQSRKFSTAEGMDLQAARENLVEALAAYRKIKPHAITVVFDGTAAQPDLPRRDRCKGIDMRFSRPGEEADAVIKRMAAREKEKLMVVSSDREVVAYAEARGAAVIGAAEFEQRLAMARYGDGQEGDQENGQEGWRPTTRKKGPARRLSKRDRRIQRKTTKL